MFFVSQDAAAGEPRPALRPAPSTRETMGCLVWIVGPGVKTESDRAGPIPVRFRARPEGSSSALVVRRLVRG